jgi:hypothetical protein
MGHAGAPGMRGALGLRSAAAERRELLLREKPLPPSIGTITPPSAIPRRRSTAASAKQADTSSSPSADATG